MAGFYASFGTVALFGVTPRLLPTAPMRSLPPCFVALALSLLVACGGGGDPVAPPPPPPDVASVSVTPASPSLVAGTTTQLTATPRDAAGAALPRAVSWSSGASSVATVSATGLVTAVAPGTAEIRATSEGVTGSTTVTVTAVPIATVTIAEPGVLVPGELAPLQATARDAAGAVLEGRAFTWTSASAAVATVSATGVVTAVAPGTAEIRATSEGITGSATVTVIPVPIATLTLAAPAGVLVPGQPALLTATARDAAGVVLEDRAITWASANAAVATVSTTGVVTAVAVGSAVITATAEGRSADVTVTVVDGGYVTAAGGTIEAAGGAVSLVMPPGAVSTGTAITVAPVADPPPHQRLVPGTAFTLGPDGLAFASPVTVRLRWTAESLPSDARADRLRVHRHDGATWTPLPDDSVDPGTRTASGVTNGFSAFALLELEGAPEIGRLVPAAIPADAGDFELIVEGAGFSPSSIVHWNGAARPTTYQSPTRLTAMIPAADVISAGTTAVGVINGGTASGSREFIIGPRVHGETLSGRSNHRCGVTVDGAALCWGSNFYRALGTGDDVHRTTPAPVVGGHVFATIAVGSTHTCALTRAGEAWCWGSDASGQLGNGPASTSAVPVPVVGGHRFTTLSAGISHNCGITPASEILCWGWGGGGILGYGGTQPRHEPTPVADDDTYRSISAGGGITCGVTTNGTGKCWGGGWLGTGSEDGALVPTPVTGGHTFTRISADEGHACGLTTSGETWCWGLGSDGQLGDGLSTTAAAPVRVAGNHTFRSIDTRWLMTCGVTTSNVGLCWGNGRTGFLGDGTTAKRPVPTPVAGGHAFARISGACGVTIAGAAWCWGPAHTITLGDGHTMESAVPIRIAPNTEFAVEAALAGARRQ